MRPEDLQAAAKSVVEKWALTESHYLGHPRVGSEHILLGLISSPKHTAAQLLAKLGVDEAEVRSEIKRLRGQGGRKGLAATWTSTVEAIADDAGKLLAISKRPELTSVAALLAIVKRPKSTGAVALANLDVNLKALAPKCEAMLKPAAGETSDGPSSAAGRPFLLIHEEAAGNAKTIREWASRPQSGIVGMRRLLATVSAFDSARSAGQLATDFRELTSGGGRFMVLPVKSPSATIVRPRALVVLHEGDALIRGARCDFAAAFRQLSGVRYGLRLLKGAFLIATNEPPSTIMAQLERLARDQERVLVQSAGGAAGNLSERAWAMIGNPAMAGRETIGSSWRWRDFPRLPQASLQL